MIVNRIILALQPYLALAANVAYDMNSSIKGLNKSLKQNISFKESCSDKKGFILLNAPGADQYDLRTLMNTVFVSANYGYKHPQYEALKPKYHVIIDNKLLDGLWPMSMLEEIHNINPTVVFVLNYKWAGLKKFKEIEGKYNVMWVSTNKIFHKWYRRPIDLTKTNAGCSAFGTCLNTLIYSGCKEINILGMQANGLAYELTNTKSHFFGENPDKGYETLNIIISSLISMAFTLRGLANTAAFCKHHGIQVTNLTSGGIAKMFHNKSFEDFIKENNSEQ